MTVLSEVLLEPMSHAVFIVWRDNTGSILLQFFIRILNGVALIRYHKHVDIVFSVTEGESPKRIIYAHANEKSF